MPTRRSLPDVVLRLASSPSFEEAAGLVLETAMEWTEAERGCLIRILGGEPRVQRRSPPPVAGEPPYSRTVLHRVIDDGRAVHIADIREDAELGESVCIASAGVRSVSGIPLVDRCGLAGVLYLDRSEGSMAVSLEILQGLAAIGSLCLSLFGDSGPEERMTRVRESDLPPLSAGPAMRGVFRAVQRMAPLPWPVLICGETGVGKERVARALHDGSPRRTGPFVTVNAAAISATLVESELFGHVRGAFTGADRDRAGLIEEADGGTLFLDEVEAMPAPVQEKLLRVLQGGEVRRVGSGQSMQLHVRVVAASNEPLDRVGGGFRQDLFHRLNVLRIDVPPLRNRREDVPLLAEHLLRDIDGEIGGGGRRLSSAAIDRLQAYSWPGNIRELENALRRAAAMSDGPVLEPEDFRFLRESPQVGPADEGILRVDEYIRRAMERHEERLGTAALAELLGVSRKTLWSHKRRWGMFRKK